MEKELDLTVFKDFQQQEIDGAALYKNIAKTLKNEHDRKTLLKIARDELNHSHIFKKYTKVTLKPRKIRLFFYTWAARILGYTFIIKLLEKGENQVIHKYREQVDQIPELEAIINDEENHEEKLLAMLKEERLNYVGDMVLGMNDALVELTGALAGYTLAMQNTKMIAMAGLITGISATLSMSASSYLSSREEKQHNAAKSSAYTGIAYLITVALLITPYLLMPEHYYLQALGVTLFIALSIIAGFNFYLAIAKDRPFAKNFYVMAGISITVALISFIIGIVVKNVLGIEI